MAILRTQKHPCVIQVHQPFHWRVQGFLRHRFFWASSWMNKICENELTSRERERAYTSKSGNSTQVLIAYVTSLLKNAIPTAVLL